jgi:hypothetical protein
MIPSPDPALGDGIGRSATNSTRTLVIFPLDFAAKPSQPLPAWRDC